MSRHLREDKVDFTNANGGSNVVALSLSMVSGTAFTIAHWTGTAGNDGLDRLLFANNPNLTQNDLRFVQFSDDNDANFAAGAMIISYNGYYELVPLGVTVLEPGTWVAGLLACAVVARRFRQCRTPRAIDRHKQDPS